MSTSRETSEISTPLLTPVHDDMTGPWALAERVRVNPKGQGIEAAARAARYAVFAAQPCDAIALAHHQDDQIETFFLAALRGGGIRALSTMPSSRVWQGKTLLRPLLAYSRAEIEAYATAHNLAHVNDSSNQDPSLLRNWLRHQMLPQLVFRLPHAALFKDYLCIS